MPNTFYVKAVAADRNQYASCQYFTDPGCQNQVFSPLTISQSAGSVVFQLVATGNGWAMVGAVADRVDTPEVDPTMVPASGPSTVSVPITTTTQVTTGIVLVFSSTVVPTQLFASSDPQVKNNGA